MKGHVVVNEMPRNLLRRFRTQCGKEWFRFGVLRRLGLGHRLLLTVVHVALHFDVSLEVKSVSIL